MARRKPEAAKRSAIHCSLGERAFTDLITNATQFSGISLEDDIRRILSVGGFPLESLPTVLHESTHHWCFMTPVMCTLAFLDTRSRMRAIEWAVTGDDSIAAAAFDDRLRHEAATAALRPLAEGLAQFFEYDVMPYPQTPVVSPPMLWANAFFGDVRDPEGSWGNTLRRALGSARLGDALVRRKTNLLLQPLDCASGGGYLPGYLTVKNLWMLFRRKHSAFYDADLCAMLIRRYFYGDYGLVNYILDTRLSGPQWLAGLIDQIGYRLDSLIKVDLPKAEKVLIETGLNPTERVVYEGWVRLSDNPPMDTDPKIAQQGLKRLGALVDDLRKSLSGSQLGEHAEALSNFQMSPIAYRHLLWLGQVDVELRPTAGGKVAVMQAGAALFEADPVHDARDTPAAGQMDLYISVYDYFIGAIISPRGSRETIATCVKGAVKEETALRFRDLYGNRARLESLQKTLADVYATLAKTFRMTELHEKLLAHVVAMSDNIYVSGAMMCVPRHLRQSVGDLMRKDGVLAVVDGDLRLLKSAAALSMAAAVRMHPEEVPAEFPDLEGQVDEVLAALDRYTNEKDFPIVAGRTGLELESFV